MGRERERRREGRQGYDLNVKNPEEEETSVEDKWRRQKILHHRQGDQSPGNRVHNSWRVTMATAWSSFSPQATLSVWYRGRGWGGEGVGVSVCACAVCVCVCVCPMVRQAKANRK